MPKYSNLKILADENFRVDVDLKRYPVEKTVGVVIFKVHPPTPGKILSAIQNLFKQLTPAEISGRLVVVTESEFALK